MKKILLDVDGVLGDFPYEVCKHFNIDEKNLPPVWDMVKPVADILKRPRQDVWEEIKNTKEIWRNMALTTEALSLYDFINRHLLSFCTSVGAGQHTWRSQWLEEHFTARKPIIYTDWKWEFVDYGILIDDKPSTVEKFKEEGGQAFLWPTYWNGNGTMPVSDKLIRLKAELSNIGINL